VALLPQRMHGQFPNQHLWCTAIRSHEIPQHSAFPTLLTVGFTQVSGFLHLIRPELVNSRKTHHFALKPPNRYTDLQSTPHPVAGHALWTATQSKVQCTHHRPQAGRFRCGRANPTSLRGAGPYLTNTAYIWSLPALGQ